MTDDDLAMFRIEHDTTLYCGLCDRDIASVKGTLRFVVQWARDHLAAHNELGRGGRSGGGQEHRPRAMPQHGDREAPLDDCG